MAAPEQSVAQEDTQEFSEEDDRLFLSLEGYCWEDDPEFQSGLNQILSGVTDPSQVRQLTRQAKCFFYARKVGRQISFDLYSVWLDREEASGPRCRSPSCEVGPPTEPTPVDAAPSGKPVVTGDETPAAPDQPENKTDAAATASDVEGKPKENDDQTPYPTSFAQIVELITSGKPIPGIREIPNTLNTEPPSQSTIQQRRKPWEIQPDSAENSLPSAEPAQV